MDTVAAGCAAVAARQHGHLTLAQAKRAGATPAHVRQQVAIGAWVRCHAGVYRVAGAPRTWAGRTIASCLAAGPDALASHRSAAALWGLEGFGPPGRVELTTPRHGRRRMAATTVHESSAFELVGATSRRGVPVTGIARTLLDVCAVAGEDLSALHALDDARRRHLVSWPELWETLILHARRGRNGVVLFRQNLLRRHGTRVPDTVFATLVARLLEDANLPCPIAEYDVVVAGRRHRIDLAYPDVRIAIECDGKVGHLNEVSFEADPQRRNRLELAGWLVLTYTWKRLTEDPASIVAEVRRARQLRAIA